MSSHYSTPEPGDGPTYDEPLLEWIGTPVVAEWCDKEIEAVVSDVELDHADHRFSGELILATGTGVSIRVAPENVKPR